MKEILRIIVTHLFPGAKATLAQRAKIEEVAIYNQKAARKLRQELQELGRESRNLGDGT